MRWLLVFVLVCGCDGPAPTDAGTDAGEPVDATRDAGRTDAGIPARYPADPRTFDDASCRADVALGWSATVPAACSGRALCIDAEGRTFRDGAPFVVRGLYGAGRELTQIQRNCPAGAACEATQPVDAAGYVGTLARAGFDLILDDVDGLPADLLAALRADDRVSVAHSLFGDPFTLAGHDALVAEIEMAAAEPEVLFWAGPDEPDLNSTWPMATGIARLLRGSSPELDALLSGPYAPPVAMPYLPATEPAHDPRGLPYASAVVIDGLGLAVASDVYDAILPITYPLQEPYSRADEGDWSVLRAERFAMPGVPMLPVLQMVPIESLGLIRPSPDQVRSLIVSSIALGADGAFYFQLASNEPAYAGRTGFYAPDDVPMWRAYSETHALWDALVPVLYSDAAVTSGRSGVLLFRRFVRGDRRVLVIANPTPYDRPVDLDEIIQRGPGEAVRHFGTCTPFTERAQIVPGYATFVLEVVPAAVAPAMGSGDPLAGLRRDRPPEGNRMPRDGSFELAGVLDRERSAHAAASLGGELWVAGGYQSALAAGRTSARGDGTTFGAGPILPFATASAAGAAAGGTFVVAGGIERVPTTRTRSLADCARWDGAWTGCAPVGNGPVSSAASAVFDDELYVLGGAVERDGGTVLTTNAVQRYSPALDGWRAETHLPAPRVSAAAMEHGGVLYVVGGTTIDGVSGMGRIAAEVLRYDLVERRWLMDGEGPPAAPLPTPRVSLSCAALDGFGYCVGGYAGGGDSLATVERLDFLSGEWTTLPDLPEALSETALVAHDGALYLLGGLTVSFDDSPRVYRLR